MKEEKKITLQELSYSYRGGSRGLALLFEGKGEALIVLTKQSGFEIKGKINEVDERRTRQKARECVCGKDTWVFFLWEARVFSSSFSAFLHRRGSVCDRF